MNALLVRLDALSEALGRALAWLMPLLMLLTVAVVLLRYGFDLGAVSLQETVLYLHGAAFLLASGYTLRHNAHVRVDIFYQHLGARRQALVDLTGALLFLLPVVAFIGWSSWSYVAASWAIGETSTDGGLPLVYLQKSLLLVFPLVLGLQGLAEILRATLVLRGEHPETFAEDRGEL